MKTPTAIQLAIHNYWNQFKKDWHLTIPVFFLAGMGSIFVVYVPPLIIAKLITLLKTDQFSNDQGIYLIILLAVAWTIGEIIWRISQHLIVKIQTHGMKVLAIEAMNQLLKKDMAFFHNNFAGTLTSRVLRYSKAYENIIEILSFQVFSNILVVIFITIVLWQYTPILVFTLFGLTILTFILVLPLIIKRKRLVTLRETASSVLHGYVADIIGNIDTVKSFAHENFEITNHTEKVRDYTEKFKNSHNYQNLYINSLMSPLYTLTNVAGIVIAIFIGQKRILSIEATFITFSYYISFTRIVWEFNFIYRGIESNLTEAAQFTEFLLTPPKIIDQENPKKFILKDSKIQFQDVDFRYNEANIPSPHVISTNPHEMSTDSHVISTEGRNLMVQDFSLSFEMTQAKKADHLFQNFNLKINSGEKIGLVGHSGGGKTTITRLLLRFMDIQKGKILIDDQNIAEITQHDLRQIIGYVPQEPIMFHRSILENIRYGRLEATEEEVKQAAEMANATEFIEKLPNQYETLVGERGIKLSGGQRQRIAIARAMLKNAPILILDEATSALDSENEKAIQGALWKLIEGRTTIVIAHRLSTIQKMDRIIVLEDGKIAEEGSHRKLLLKNGVYAGLWKHQSGGFLED